MSNSASGIFQNAATSNPFPATSRYAQIETAKLEIALDQTPTTPDGSLPDAPGSRPAAETKTVVYLRRRFVPPQERFETLLEHPVAQGDRIDNLTAKYLGDPEQFWRVCDANNAMQPDELTATVGRTIRITLPEGIPGQPHA
jgi:hypothetical protein